MRGRAALYAVLGILLTPRALALADEWADRISANLTRIEKGTEALDAKKAYAQTGLEDRVRALDQRIGDLEEKRGLARGRVSIKPEGAWIGSMSAAVVDLDRRLKQVAAPPVAPPSAPLPTAPTRAPPVGPKRGFVGFQADPVEYESRAVWERRGISAERGVVVWDVVDGSPAAKAGLQRGDILTHYAGKLVPSTLGIRKYDPASAERWLRDWNAITNAIKVGDVVEIVATRGGESVTLSATAADFAVLTMLRARQDTTIEAMFLDAPDGTTGDALKACLPAVKQRLLRHGYQGIECSLDDDSGRPLIRLDAKSGFPREMRERVASLVRLPCKSVELRCTHTLTGPEREQWVPPRAPEGMKWIPLLRTPELTRPERGEPISWYLALGPVIRGSDTELVITSDKRACLRISAAVAKCEGVVLVLDGWVADYGNVRAEDGASTADRWFPSEIGDRLADVDACIRNPLPFALASYAPK